MRRQLQNAKRRAILPGMSDEQKNQGDVGEAHTDELQVISGETRVEQLPNQPPPTEVRIGGQPGVRVTQQGLITRKRVAGGDAFEDHRQVPITVLASVRELVGPGEIDLKLTAAERLTLVYEQLAPWL